MLNKDQILEADDLKKEVVPVPQWGGEVIVKTLTAIEWQKLIQSFRAMKEEITDEYLKVKVLVATVCDESGNCIFGEDDIIKLGKKSGATIEKVFSVASKLNRLLASDLEELEKNLETTRSNDLHTD